MPRGTALLQSCAFALTPSALLLSRAGVRRLKTATGARFARRACTGACLAVRRDGGSGGRSTLAPATPLRRSSALSSRWLTARASASSVSGGGRDRSSSGGGDGDGDEAEAAEAAQRPRSKLPESSLPSTPELERDRTTQKRVSIPENVGADKLSIAFTCNQCDARVSKQFSRHAYHHGVVIIQCPSCESKHLIADNLGWYTSSALTSPSAKSVGGRTVEDWADVQRVNEDVFRLEEQLRRERRQGGERENGDGEGDGDGDGNARRP